MDHNGTSTTLTATEQKIYCLTVLVTYRYAHVVPEHMMLLSHVQVRDNLPIGDFLCGNAPIVRVYRK